MTPEEKREDFKKMFDEEMQKYDDKMSTAKEWLTPKEYFLLLRGLSNHCDVCGAEE